MTFTPKRVLAVTPHADDVTLFAGGTLALWASQGAHICVLRVTDDEKDSFELSPDDAADVNGAQFEEAMKVLGVAETRHLSYRDCEMMDVPYGQLRERLIEAIRQVRPDLVVSFDPTDQTDENPDHGVVARAVADASWAAAYPNFHPEHAKRGLMPHAPLGNYYFTRHFVMGDEVVDITSVLPQKIRAVICHDNMMRTVMTDQLRRVRASLLPVSAAHNLTQDDCAAYWTTLIGAASGMAAQGTGCDFAERFRSTLLTKDDPLVQLLMSMGE